jgi:sirohydrochlorin ferrochelatase
MAPEPTRKAGTMAMSDEHKAALARGRNEARALKRYLEAIGARKPGRPARPETLHRRLRDLETKIDAETDPLARVHLLQRRIDTLAAVNAAKAHSDMTVLEAGFVAHAAPYSERKGISYSAWREAGVPADVLRRAGIGRS